MLFFLLPFLLGSSALAAGPLRLDIERVVDQAFSGTTEVFKEFDFNFIACARNFLRRTDVSIFTYSAKERECIGFTQITGYSIALEGTETFFVRRENAALEAYLDNQNFICAEDWMTLKGRCFKQVDVTYTTVLTDMLRILKTACSEQTGISAARSASIHSEEENHFLASETDRPSFIGITTFLTSIWLDNSAVDYSNWEDDHSQVADYSIFVYILPDGEWTNFEYSTNRQSRKLWCAYDLN